MSAVDQKREAVELAEQIILKVFPFDFYRFELVEALAVELEAYQKQESDKLFKLFEPLLRANVSSTVCRGCHSCNEPGAGVTPEGYTTSLGYVLLGNGHINQPWHHSCAERALGEWYNQQRQEEVKKL